MTTVSILADSNEASTPRFRAVAGKHESVGKTAGEALDALNAQIGNLESASLIMVQHMQSDLFFSEVQYLRLRDLLEKRSTLTKLEQGELERLVKDELIASAKRTEALADALGR